MTADVDAVMADIVGVPEMVVRQHGSLLRTIFTRVTHMAGAEEEQLCDET